MRAPRLSAAEVLERLHLTRQVLSSVLESARLARSAGRLEWQSGQAIFDAIGALERYADRRLRRPEIAAYAHDLEAYARTVLGELVTGRGR